MVVLELHGLTKVQSVGTRLDGVGDWAVGANSGAICPFQLPEPVLRSKSG